MSKKMPAKKKNVVACPFKKRPRIKRSAVVQWKKKKNNQRFTIYLKAVSWKKRDAH